MDNKFTYPAFVQAIEEGFGVFFPTIFPEDGWEYPLCSGATRAEALRNAEVRLAYTLAGILYDNEPLPAAGAIAHDDLDVVSVETSFEPYAKDIAEHLQGRHWHITYYDEEHMTDAIGYKNEAGLWDIYFVSCQDGDLDVFAPFLQADGSEKLLFTAHSYDEAYEKFEQFVVSALRQQEMK